jgi:DNA-binding response OmpR family regulator
VAQKENMKKILLIEDHADAREMLRDALAAAGYDVTAVADGSAGIEAQRRAPADLVVTDLFMPEKEGLETITELRRKFPQTRIIAISGGSRLRVQQIDHLATAREIGADDVLSKPFDPAQLVDAVQRLLG